VIAPLSIPTGGAAWQSIPWPDLCAAMHSHAELTHEERCRIAIEPIGGWLSSGAVFHAVLAPKSDGGRSFHFLIKRSPYARLEARWLDTIDRKFTGTVMAGTIPRLVAFFGDHDTLVTDYRAGARNFGASLLRAAVLGTEVSTQGPLLALARALGEWLGRFHATTHEGEVLGSGLIKELNMRIDELHSIGFAPSSGLRAALRSGLDRLGPVPAVLSHGDFAPRNVLMTGSGVHVVDWEMVPDQPMPFLFDLFHCLGVIRKRHPLLRRQVQDRIADEVTTGYLEKCPFPDWVGPSWRPVRLMALLMLLSRQVRAARRGRVRSWLTGKALFIQQLTKEISDELECC